MEQVEGDTEQQKEKKAAGILFKIESQQLWEKVNIWRVFVMLYLAVKSAISVGTSDYLLSQAQS